MKLSGNHVLITGGASGIGLALAERFLKAGSDVVICGRRADALERARAKWPALATRVADLSIESERVALHDWAVREFPRLNVLVNNAGIQERLSLKNAADWPRASQELTINIDAPIHLSMLFAADLTHQPSAAIVNVTSGLSFVPLAQAPIYSATKAALHSFTLSLRRQLADTHVEVIEIIPPAVDTDLGGPGLHTFGVKVDEFVDVATRSVDQGAVEVAYGFSEQTSRASRAELDAIFTRLNSPATHA